MDQEEQKILNRINELYHLKQTRGLTEAEKAERKELHAKYIKIFRAGFKQELEDTVIFDKNGHEVTSAKAKAVQRRRGLRKD